ncbi:MAG: AAA family ATPase, partial [Lachnospirales bacterium]
LLDVNLSTNLLNNKDEIITLINSFDENIIDIMYVSGKYSNKAELKLKHKINGWLNLSSFGDGIRKVVLIVSTITSSSNCGILLIDEIETSLHVSALENVYSWLVKVCKERNIQLFVTTHSLEALTTLTEIGVEDDDIDLVVYKLENYKNDIIIKRIEEHRAMDILEDGGDLR